MSKKVLPILVILIAIGAIAFWLVSKQTTNPAMPDDNTAVIPDVSTDIIWNAYTLQGTAFIYPADWMFEEVKDGFKITYPISSNSFDTIEAGGACPEVTIPEIHNACINGIWLHTQSENDVVLGVFADMKKFGESESAETATQ